MSRDSRRCIAAAAALCACLIASSAQAGTYAEAEVAKFFSMLNICGEPLPEGVYHDKVQGCFKPIPAEWYDGKEITTNIPAEFNQAYKMWQSFKAHREKCVGKWNQSNDIKSSKHASHFLKVLEERTNYVNAALAAIQRAEKRVSATGDKCNAWNKEVKNKDRLWAVKMLMGKESKVWLTAYAKASGASANHQKKGAIDRLANLRRLSGEIHAACQSEAYQGDWRTWCVKKSMNRVIEEEAPQSWCDVAADADKHLSALLEGFIADTIAAQKLPFDVSKNGNVWTGKPFHLSDLELNDKTKGQILEQFQELFDAATLTFEPSPDLFAPLEAKFAEARQFIKDSVNDYTPAKTHTTAGYGKALGKKAVQERYPATKVKKVWMSSGKWDISKNAFDIPTHRKAWGHAIYQVKGEPWCRDGQFVIFEEYEGSGKYQKDDEAYIEVESFHVCK